MLDATEGEELEAMRRYMVIALKTWARPEAITELSVLKQVDRAPPGIINLNPPVRVQIGPLVGSIPARSRSPSRLASTQRTSTGTCCAISWPSTFAARGSVSKEEREL
jgi:hypothetical protein